MTIDLFSREVRQDPYPVYDELRRTCPVHHDECHDVWFVSRYRDVERVLKDSETFSNAASPLEKTLRGADAKAHARVRKILNAVFTPAHVGAWEHVVRSLAQELVERIATRGECDLIGDLAVPLPISVLARILDIDFARRDELCRWSQAIVHSKTSLSADERRDIAEQIRECRAFLTDHFGRAARNANRGPIVEALVGAGGSGGLTVSESVDIGLLLVVAATETTTNTIGHAALMLTRDPAWQERLRRNPGLIPAFVEEMLRYEPPVQRVGRATTRSAKIGTRQLPQGARVHVLLGSANRDPAAFPDADQFRIERDPSRHIAFGSGPRFCPGGHLARLEVAIALETLVRRLPGLTRTRPSEIVDFGSSFSLRGPRRLHLSIAALPQGEDGRSGQLTEHETCPLEVFRRSEDTRFRP